MQFQRTPEARFDHLPDWPYATQYQMAHDGLRMAYIDEGPKEADRVFLCLHGQPTWSYLYRHMIPVFAQSGARVVAPDLYGFGKSDKPTEDAQYSYGFHRASLLALIDALDLKNITLVVQDWGGVLGLTLPMDRPDRFDRLLIMNTALATGIKPSQGFMDWLAYSNANPDLAVGKLMSRSVPHLTQAEADAYDAPFPDITYKAGVRRFPQLVMIAPDMEGVDLSKRAAKWWATDWSGDSFMAIGATDPVLGPDVMERMHHLIKGCPPPLILQNAGHFVQEWGAEVAHAALTYWRDTAPKNEE